MPAVSTSVKYFHSAMPGAPVLNGTAGSLIAVLDACLVNGFGLKTATSVVVASNIATVTISGGVGAFEADCVVTVSGATPAGLNGDKRVIAVTATTLTFDATGIAAGTATGTITVKLTPAGWAKSFSGTNLAVYRSNDVLSTRMFLRVDDTGTVNARVVGYDSMSDVSTGTGIFPTDLQVSGGNYWPKSNEVNDTYRTWTVVADSKTFYIYVHTRADALGVNGTVHGFGDFTSLKSGDAYSAFVSGSNWEGVAYDQSSWEGFGMQYSAINNYYIYSPRSITGIGSSVGCYKFWESYATTTEVVSGAGGLQTTPTYPNLADNSLLLTRSVVVEPSVCLRGYMRGFLNTPQNCNSAFSWRDKIVGVGTYAGKKLLAVKCGISAGHESRGVLFFDITGPWS